MTETADREALKEQAIEIGLEFVDAKRTAREAYDAWSEVAEALPEAEFATEAVRVLNLATAAYVQVNELLNQHFSLEEQGEIARLVGQRAGIDDAAIDAAIESVTAAQEAQAILEGGDQLL